MIFDKKQLVEAFEQAAEDKTPEEFLNQKCKELLSIWLQSGKDAFKQVGPYWEALNPVLAKYAPKLYESYANLVGGLEVVNNQVLSAYNYEQDELNFMAALQYMSMRQDSMQTPNETHVLDIDGEEIIYIPNQLLDQDFYHGREAQE